MESDAARLNDPEVLPPLAYRRNDRNYELVCYVNCLIGCRVSGNAEGIALFEYRIKRFVADYPPTAETSRYYDAMNNYVGSFNR